LLLSLDSSLVTAEWILLLDRAPVEGFHRGAAGAPKLGLEAGDLSADEYAVAGDDPRVAQLAPNSRN